MKIIIPGGAGHLGTLLARQFHRRGDDVAVLSRSPRPARWRVVPWDGRTGGAWEREIDGADVVINLAGQSVNCRYTPRNREAILASRLLSTRAIGEAIARSSTPPRLWLQASTATIYAHRYDAPNDEAGALGGCEPDVPKSWRFSTDVANAWEAALDRADVPRTRKVKMRTAMVMSPDRGGTFDMLLRLVRLGLGGRAGDGRQFMSWIHHLDFVRAVEWLIDDEDLYGRVNVAAPDPIPNDEFMRAIREAWGAAFGMSLTRWMLGAGALLLGTESELILKSRRVIPGRLVDNGFDFRFPNWAEAARDLCDEWRELHGRELRPHLVAGSSRF